jgi:hypothetical protein
MDQEQGRALATLLDQPPPAFDDDRGQPRAGNGGAAPEVLPEAVGGHRGSAAVDADHGEIGGGQQHASVITAGASDRKERDHPERGSDVSNARASPGSPAASQLSGRIRGPTLGARVTG